MTSYKAEVIADSSAQWIGNALRFATMSEAMQYAQDLRARWTMVTDTRAVECAEPANYEYVAGAVKRLT